MCLQQQLERNQVVCTKDGYQISTETAFKKYVSKNEEDGPVFLINEAEKVIPSTSTVQTAPVFTPVQQQTVTAVQNQAAEASYEALGGDEGEVGVPGSTGWLLDIFRISDLSAYPHPCPNFIFIPSLSYPFPLVIHKIS